MFTFLDEPRRTEIVTAIVGTTDPEELEGALEGSESLEHLESLDLYIVNDVDAEDLPDRVEVFTGLEGVFYADTDREMDLSSWDPNDDSDAVFWYLNDSHNAGFTTNSNGPFGWDVRRQGASTVVGVIDTGIAGLNGSGVATNSELPSRILGARTVGSVLEEETSSPVSYPAFDFMGHGTAVAGAIAALSDNDLTLGVSWWGTPVCPIKFVDSVVLPYLSNFLRGLEYGLARGIKVFSFQCDFSEGEPPASFYNVLDDQLEEFNALLFWGCTNSNTGDRPDADKENLVFVGSTRAKGYPVSYSGARDFFDCRAAVGESDAVAYDRMKILTAEDNAYSYDDGHSFAAPQGAGLCAMLFDALPASLTDEERKDLALDILLRTCNKVFRPAGGGTEPDPDNWGRISIRNAMGIPPASVSVVTGTGSPNVEDFWREDSTVTAISSDEGVGGTLRLKVNTVHPCPYADQDTVNDLHFRFRIGGLNTTATLKIKHDNGSFATVGTFAVTTSPVLSEIYVYNWEGEPNIPDYVDSSGNVTLRIEVPGPANQAYSVTFDQVAIRFLRASEEE